MTRLLWSMGLVLFVGLSTALAEPAKEAPKKAPLTEEQKAERAKKWAENVEKMFKNKDKNNDGKLTLEELKGKATKPEVIARMEKLMKAKDKDGDGALTKEELLAKPERKKGEKKHAGKKKAAEKQ